MVHTTLVTGGNGFIGSNLVKAMLDADGRKVIVLDKRDGYKIEEHDRVIQIRGDITNKKLVFETVEKVDTIVHLAAETAVLDSISNPVESFETNVIGTMNLLEAAKTLGRPKFINASTGGAIIGDAIPPVHEDMVANPISPYGASKLAVEGYCSAYSACYEIPIISLRFANVYGPGSLHKGSVIAQFIKNILAGNKIEVFGDGTQERDYIYCQDLCLGILNAEDSQATGVFQLGTGAPTSINVLLRELSEVINQDISDRINFNEFKKGEILKTYCDINKAKRYLNFQPSTTLNEGLRKTWDWFVSESIDRANS